MRGIVSRLALAAIVLAPAAGAGRASARPPAPALATASTAAAPAFAEPPALATSSTAAAPAFAEPPALATASTAAAPASAQPPALATSSTAAAPVSAQPPALATASTADSLRAAAADSSRVRADSIFDRPAAPVLTLPPAAELPSARYLPPPGAVYVAEEVRVRSLESHSLAGTLTLPWRPFESGSRRTRFPAVVLITAEGGWDRDQAPADARGLAQGGEAYRPFFEIADTLTKRGIAVLRLDDRGFGASTGSLDTADTFDRSYDTRAALDYLRRRAEIDPKRLGLLGMSEGATIAALIARFEPGLCGIVLMAGPADAGRAAIEWQQRRRVAADAAIAPGRRDSAVAARMAEWDARAASERRAGFISSYDPIETARHVSTPVLVLQGDADEDVPADGAGRLASAFREGGSADVTVRVFPGLTHAFLPAGASGANASNPPRPQLPKDVLGTIADWFSQRLGGASARIKSAPDPGRSKQGKQVGGTKKAKSRRSARRGGIVPAP